MAAEASRSCGAADSYIGSLISLTSKYEIRYEGILYNINTEESSIGLRNVRSFGTEGRKKDGPQVPPSDKVYEYILFRGSDIKDLQVKSSPPAPTATPIHNDPAIIQSHYSRPLPSVCTSSPSAASGTTPDPSSHATQLGLTRSTVQSGVPLYASGGNLGSWGSSPTPPNPNGSGLTMPPMYWPGFYGPTSGLPPHLQQHPLLRPPPGLPIPPSMQQPMQYSGISTSLPNTAANLTEFPSPLLPSVNLPATGGSYPNLTSSILPMSAGSVQVSALASETSPSLVPNKPTNTSLLPTITTSANLQLLSPISSSSLDINSIVPPISSKPITMPTLPSQTVSQLVSVVGPSTSAVTETLVVPPLVIPGQLLQTAPSTLTSSQSLAVNKDLEIVQPVLSEPSSSTANGTQAPILPLPPLPNHKMNGTTFPSRHISRGRERGRGNGVSHAVTKFTEDFDFTAMNEKFKKDEVWGHLGKSKVFKEDGKQDFDDILEENEMEASKLEVQPVYVKDDFFDSLSCNSLDQGPRNGRTRFSEQMKIDTETFGDFPRQWGGRSGRGPARGGRGRGSYYGRAYGYVGRGRGQAFYRAN